MITIRTALFAFFFIIILGCKKEDSCPDTESPDIDMETDVEVAPSTPKDCPTIQFEDLVAHYTLDGHANDNSGYENHGLIEGPIPAMDRKMNEASALYFDGNDDIIQVEDDNELYLGCELTLSAWIHTDSIKSQQILRKGAHVNGKYSWPYGLSLSGTNDIIFSVTSWSKLFQARKSGYETNTWYLITGVLKDETMYLYVNGNLEATESTFGIPIDDPLPLLIGTRLRLPSSTFHGIIDDVRVYDYALSEQEVWDLYNE